MHVEGCEFYYLRLAYLRNDTSGELELFFILWLNVLADVNHRLQPLVRTQNSTLTQRIILLGQ